MKFSKTIFDSPSLNLKSRQANLGRMATSFLVLFFVVVHFSPEKRESSFANLIVKASTRRPGELVGIIEWH